MCHVENTDDEHCVDFCFLSSFPHDRVILRTMVGGSDSSRQARAHVVFNDRRLHGYGWDPSSSRKIATFLPS